MRPAGNVLVAESRKFLNVAQRTCFAEPNSLHARVNRSSPSAFEQEFCPTFTGSGNPSNFIFVGSCIQLAKFCLKSLPASTVSEPLGVMTLFPWASTANSCFAKKCIEKVFFCEGLRKSVELTHLIDCGTQSQLTSDCFFYFVIENVFQIHLHSIEFILLQIVCTCESRLCRFGENSYHVVCSRVPYFVWRIATIIPLQEASSLGPHQHQ